MLTFAYHDMNKIVGRHCGFARVEVRERGLPPSGRHPESCTGGEEFTDRVKPSSGKDERQDRAVTKLILALEICDAIAGIVTAILCVAQILL